MREMKIFFSNGYNKSQIARELNHEERIDTKIILEFNWIMYANIKFL